MIISSDMFAAEDITRVPILPFKRGTASHLIGRIVQFVLPYQASSPQVVDLGQYGKDSWNKPCGLSSSLSPNKALLTLQDPNVPTIPTFSLNYNQE